MYRFFLIFCLTFYHVSFSQNIKIPFTLSGDYVLMDENTFLKASREAQMGLLDWSSEQIQNFRNQIKSVDSDFYLLRNPDGEFNWDENITIIDYTPFFLTNDSFNTSFSSWLEQSTAEQISNIGEVIYTKSGMDKFLDNYDYLFIEIIAKVLFETEYKTKHLKSVFVKSGDTYFFITINSLQQINLNNLFVVTNN